MECIVCCDPMECFAMYPCTHIICYKCATKLTFMYKDKACPLCKSSKGKPIFKSGADEDVVPVPGPDQGCLSNTQFLKEGDSCANRAGAASDSACLAGKPYFLEDENAIYTSEAMYNKIGSLLVKRCKKCKRVCKNNEMLADHYKEAHSKLPCFICLNNNHQFWFEVSLYDPEALEKHKKGRLSEAGFAGHTFCVHCSVYFYNKEEAKKHCQSEHQLCTVCDILGRKFQFYRNYSALEDHYRSQHYCCTNSLCVKNLCYVYAYKSELWTHCLTQHSLDIHLADIKLGGRENPPVCSIGNTEEADTDSLYRQPPNITTPLVNEPYFPSFESTDAIPDFMNRSIIAQEDHISNVRVKQIQSITKTFYNEINVGIGKYIEGTKELATLINEIESAVGNQVCLRILENINFVNKSREVKEFLKDYKRAVTFPTFQQTSAPVPKSNKKQSKPLFSSFKILDTSKKR